MSISVAITCSTGVFWGEFSEIFAENDSKVNLGGLSSTSMIVISTDAVEERGKIPESDTETVSE